jgi:hypothetical protein
VLFAATVQLRYRVFQSFPGEVGGFAVGNVASANFSVLPLIANSKKAVSGFHKIEIPPFTPPNLAVVLGCQRTVANTKKLDWLVFPGCCGLWKIVANEDMVPLR